MITCDFLSTEMMRIPLRIGGDGGMAEAKLAFSVVPRFVMDAAGNVFPAVVLAAASPVPSCISNSPGKESLRPISPGATARPTSP